MGYQNGFLHSQSFVFILDLENDILDCVGVGLFLCQPVHLKPPNLISLTTLQVLGYIRNPHSHALDMRSNPFSPTYDFVILGTAHRFFFLHRQIVFQFWDIEDLDEVHEIFLKRDAPFAFLKNTAAANRTGHRSL